MVKYCKRVSSINIHPEGVYMVIAACSFLIASVIFSAIAACTQFASVQLSGRRFSSELKWILEETPALNSLLAIMAQSAVFVVLISGLESISNHIIISLDIIYFFTLLILIYLHIIKNFKGQFSVI